MIAIKHPIGSLVAPRPRLNPAIWISALLAALLGWDEGPASAQGIRVRTGYKAIVLHYNPHVRKGEQLIPVAQAYSYRDVDALCRDYIGFLRKASGGQVSFSIAHKYELDEFPPDNDPEVTFTPEDFDQLHSQGYDMFDHGKADYLAICNDPRFNIVREIEAGQADAVWIFAPEGTGFWETAMAGRDAYWVNGGAYPEVNCSRRFVLFGFGIAAHQGVGFMLENTAHMSEVIMHDRISAGWPKVHHLREWSTLNLNNPGRKEVVRDLNDWSCFTCTDAVHWDATLVAPGNSQAGLSHFPPTACMNYGWSPVRIDFDAPWDLRAFEPYGGSWGLKDGNLVVSARTGDKAILYGSHDLSDDLGKYKVPVIITDADIQTSISISSNAPGSHAGVLLRCSRYANGANAADGYYLGMNAAEGRIELARVNNAYTVLASKPMQVQTNVAYDLSISLRGPVISAALSLASAPALIYTNLGERTDGAVGFCAYNTEATFSRLYVTPAVRNYAERWRTYPSLGSTAGRQLSPAEWSGDGKPYSDMDYWYAWWYEHLPKNPGTHEVLDPATGRILGRCLNSWWPYVWDINTFTEPFLPDTNIISAAADTLPPEAPTGLRGSGLSASCIAVRWDEPPDNIGVTRYEVYRDGLLIRRTPLRYFNDTNLAPNSTHSYSVKALDGSANSSVPSRVISVKTLESDALLGNPQIEIGLDLPVFWETNAFDAGAIFIWGEDGRNGSRCLCIDAGSHPNDARWIQEITGLTPHGHYVLSGWVKGQDVVLESGATVGVNLCAFTTWDHSETSLCGTFDWTKVQADIYADSEGKLTVGCRLGYWGNLAQGKAWFDDLALEHVPPAIVPAAAWGLDAWNLTSLPPELTNAVTLAAGDTHCLALRSDGSVIAWGHGSSGECRVPAGLREVIGIAAGGSCSLAVRADGQLLAWGEHVFGQTNLPSGLTAVIAAAAGSRFCVALKADGTVVAWGENHWGETNVPPGLAGVVAIDAGHEFALALKADGTVAGWGSFMGSDDHAYPAYVPEGLSNVVQVACGASHALALKSDGTVVAWGDSFSGETEQPTGLGNVVAVSAAGNHSLALLSGGSVTGWGGNQFGELDVPAEVTNAWAVECTPYCSLALLGDSLPRATVRPSRMALQGQTARIQFPSHRGQSYFLLCRSSLEEQGWSFLHGLAAVGDISSFWDAPAVEPRRFYSVRTKPEK